MAFDPNPHMLRQIVIRCGKLLHPEEKDITKLYEETSKLVGAVPFSLSSSSMTYDGTVQLVQMIILAAGDKIRELKGLDKETDLKKLFDDTLIELNLGNLKFDQEAERKSVEHSRLPAAHEMLSDNGKPIIPRKTCPSCNKAEGLILYPLCQGCKDADGGKYKTIWFCGQRTPLGDLVPDTGCGHSERSEKQFVNWLNDMGVNFKNMTKEAMGIKTYTDEGMK